MSQYVNMPAFQADQVMWGVLADNQHAVIMRLHARFSPLGKHITYHCTLQSCEHYALCLCCQDLRPSTVPDRTCKPLSCTPWLQLDMTQAR